MTTQVSVSILYTQIARECRFTTFGISLREMLHHGTWTYYKVKKHEFTEYFVTA